MTGIDKLGADLDARGDLAVERIRPAYQQVADQLRALILRGDLGPGDRLPVEAELSSVFGVSRSTIREALRLLSSHNLVYSVRGAGGGTFVAVTNPDNISDYLETSIGLLSGSQGITADELLEARELLEIPAARLAAERRTEEDLVALRQAVADEKSEVERGRRFGANQRFHGLILEAAENRLLDVMTVPVFRVIRSRFLQEHTDEGFWDSVDDDHTRILEHIEAGDGEAAARAMTEHLARLRPTYAEVDRTQRSARD